MPSLMFTAGRLAGRRLPIEAEIVIGRVEADVTIDDPLMSRRHAVIRPANGALEVEDLGSLNGTWVNGQRISATTRLEPGDVVTVGETSIEVEDDHPRTVLARTPSAAELGMAAADALGKERDAEESAADELRTVTALFADVVGSTGLGERLEPHEVKTVIGECVSRMTRAVEQFGGTVQAYMGDGIAAFFGVPTAHEDDPERAARAGLRILDVIREYAKEVELAWGISDFNARVGINTGETAVGLVGAADPQSVSLGDTTNVAARLQSAAAPGTIAAGELTAKSLVHRFVVEPLGPVQVKGRLEPVEAWRLVSAETSARPAPRSPLVGRDAEVARLRGVVDDLRAGRGQVLLLLGETGIGKTRLLEELRALTSDGVTWLEGQCLSYGTDQLYGPMIQMLRAWVGVDEGEADLSVRTKLRANLGLLPAADAGGVYPYLAHVLGVKLEPDEHARLHALPREVLSREIRRAYTTWLESLAQQGPVVVAIEDLHWADALTSDLAGEQLELLDRLPVLVVATSRIDPASEGWRLRVHALTTYAHRTVEMSVQPLPEDAALALLEGLPRSGELSSSDLADIVTRAEGNPLYLAELLNAAVDLGGLRAQTWAPRVTGAMVLTPTLESLLLARIDRLPPGVRRVAQVAAVIGRNFPLRVLEHVARTDDLEGDLAALLRADVIRELRRYPEVEYTFRHGLLREASLSTLPPPRRQELYRAVAVAFETVFAGSLEDRLEVLGHYYARSHDPKALDYLERAAVRAGDLGADARAAELWRRTRELAEKLGDDAVVARATERLAGLETADDRREAPRSADTEPAGPA